MVLGTVELLLHNVLSSIMVYNAGNNKIGVELSQVLTMQKKKS